MILTWFNQCRAPWNFESLKHRSGRRAELPWKRRGTTASGKQRNSLSRCCFNFSRLFSGEISL